VRLFCVVFYDYKFESEAPTKGVRVIFYNSVFIRVLVGVPEMALGKNKTILQSQKTLWITVAAVLVTSSSASAQTVVIGGSNQQPISVNMTPTYGAYRPNQQILSGNSDFSKGAQIIDGDEVITLTPPGSRPKKKRVAAKPVQKSKPKTVAVKKAVVAKPKPKSVVKVPALAVAAKPVEKAPSKTVATTPAPMAKKTIAVAPPKPKMSTPPKEVAATKETKKPTPIIPRVAEPTKEPEIKVAAVAPEEASKPVGPSNPVPAIQPETQEGLQQIFFDKGETKLPANGTSELKKLAGVVTSSNQRIQLVAYADASSNGTARRLSLGRALVIRSELMALGVPNNKIEVRALGKPTDSSPADRVDLKLVAR